MRTTRVGKVKETADLIEGLASSVVKGSAELTNIRCDVINQQKIRVATGNNQADKSLGQRTVGELIDRKVPDHVINPVQRFSDRRGQRLRRANTNRQGAHQAGTRSDGHSIDIVKSHAGLVKGAFKRGKERLKVSA